LSRALRRELAARGLPGDGGRRLTVATAALVVLCFVSLFFIVPALALWVTHWIEMAGYCRRLRQTVLALPAYIGG